jgi:hypothetical protein
MIHTVDTRCESRADRYPGPSRLISNLKGRNWSLTPREHAVKKPGYSKVTGQERRGRSLGRVLERPLAHGRIRQTIGLDIFVARDV